MATARVAKRAVAKKVAATRGKRAPQKVVVHAVKGFDADLKCLGYQYRVGETFEHSGAVRMCGSGFHCIDGNPLDVLNYYPLIGEDGRLNRFCSVVASGEIKRDETSKIVAAKLTVSLELTIPELIKKSVAFVIDACKAKDERVQAASGDSSQLAASGDSSQLAASGHYSQLAASGHYSKLAASGHYSQLAASGYYSQLAASGHYSQLAASGYYSKLAASGDSSQLAASGYYSQLAASGDSSQLAASGHYSKLAASGHYSKLEISGEHSAAAAVGPNSTIRAKAGTPIAICEYDRNGKPIGFATGIAGKDCPADTWLIAKNGKLVEAE